MKSRTTFLILLIVAIIMGAKGACLDGEYDNSGTCVKCSSECSTCNSGSSCLTCAIPQKAWNSTSNSCSFCSEGYVNVVNGVGTCTACHQICGKYCLGPTSNQCLSCSGTLGMIYLHVDSLTCIDNCDSMMVIDSDNIYGRKG